EPSSATMTSNLPAISRCIANDINERTKCAGRSYVVRITDSSSCDGMRHALYGYGDAHRCTDPRGRRPYRLSWGSVEENPQYRQYETLRLFRLIRPPPDVSADLRPCYRLPCGCSILT